jgi:hypothetical protein
MTKPMSDKEFIFEIRRGLICIMRAMLRKYSLTWLDFFPKECDTFQDLPLEVDITERMK